MDGVGGIHSSIQDKYTITSPVGSRSEPHSLLVVGDLRLSRGRLGFDSPLVTSDR